MNARKRFSWCAFRLFAVLASMVLWLGLFMRNWRVHREHIMFPNSVGKQLFAKEIQSFVFYFEYVIQMTPTGLVQKYKLVCSAILCQYTYLLLNENSILSNSGTYLMLFSKCSSTNGDLVHQFQYSLKLEDDGQLLVLYPLTVCHVIDNESPLYNLSARDLLMKRWE